MGIIPYSGTTWSTYETLKERLLHSRGLPPTGELPPIHNALCGGLAGIMGARRLRPPAPRAGRGAAEAG